MTSSNRHHDARGHSDPVEADVRISNWTLATGTRPVGASGVIW